MLIEALAPGRPLQTTRDVFSLLAAPTMDVHAAARPLVRAIKTVALQDVKTTTAGRVVRDGLESMALSFRPLAVPFLRKPHAGRLERWGDGTPERKVRHF
jgi:hypothetical protein